MCVCVCLCHVIKFTVYDTMLISVLDKLEFILFTHNDECHWINYTAIENSDELLW